MLFRIGLTPTQTKKYVERPYHTIWRWHQMWKKNVRSFLDNDDTTSDIGSLPVDDALRKCYFVYHLCDEDIAHIFQLESHRVREWRLNNNLPERIIAYKDIDYDQRQLARKALADLFWTRGIKELGPSASIRDLMDFVWFGLMEQGDAAGGDWVRQWYYKEMVPRGYPSMGPGRHFGEYNINGEKKRYASTRTVITAPSLP